MVKKPKVKKTKPKKASVKTKKAAAKKPVRNGKAKPGKAPAKSAKPVSKKLKKLEEALDVFVPVEKVLPWRQPITGETFVGFVDDYLSHVSVITMTLSEPLKVGNRIHIRGN
ncbi:MAG: hypothetical protein HY548_05790, partial [Elusimicrobia bacterium]|nr:hypothetical protein [Elusimicrobiota bacterium]